MTDHPTHDLSHEQDTTYVSGMLNGKPINFPELLTRTDLVRFYEIDAKSTILVTQPGAVEMRPEDLAMTIKPHTDVRTSLPS